MVTALERANFRHHTHLTEQVIDPDTGEPGGVHPNLATHQGLGLQATLTAASQVEMEAGAEAAIRSMSPLRIAQAIAALETPGSLTQAYVGRDAIGASYEVVTTTRVVAKKVTIATACLLTDIEVYIKQIADAEAGQLCTFLYSDNGSGTAPKLLMGSWISGRNMVLEEASAGPREARWMGNPAGKWLTAADYWIAWLLNDTDFNIAYDTGGSDPYMVTTSPQIGDWGLWTPVDSTRNYSIRANTIR